MKLKFRAISIASLVVVASGIFYLLWNTRSRAVPGEYHAAGVWGSSTLMLRNDHTLTQEVNFLSQYTKEASAPKVISGQWAERGRNFFNQEILIKPFIGLGALDKGKVYDAYPTSYGPVALSGLGIEIDISQGIVYRK